MTTWTATTLDDGTVKVQAVDSIPTLRGAFLASVTVSIEPWRRERDGTAVMLTKAIVYATNVLRRYRYPFN